MFGIDPHKTPTWDLTSAVGEMDVSMSKNFKEHVNFNDTDINKPEAAGEEADEAEGMMLKSAAHASCTSGMSTHSVPLPKTTLCLMQRFPS